MFLKHIEAQAIRDRLCSGAGLSSGVGRAQGTVFDTGMRRSILAAMRIHRTIVLLVAVALSVAAAQEAWVVPFAAAFQPDIAGFNQGFSENGLPEAASRHYGWGIELRSLVKNVLVGPMFFRTWDDADNGDYQLRTDASGIFGEAGLKLSPVSFLSIVPMIGVGGLSQSFSIRKSGQERVPFDSLLQLGQTNVSSGMKLAGLAALEIGLSASTSSGRYGVAFRAGYLYSPSSVTWHLANGAVVTDAPDAMLRGPFLSLGLVMMPSPQTSVSQF